MPNVDRDEAAHRIRTGHPARCAGDETLCPRRATVVRPKDDPPAGRDLLVEGHRECMPLVDEAKLVERADAGDLRWADTLPGPARVARLREGRPGDVAKGDPADELCQDIERGDLSGKRGRCGPGRRRPPRYDRGRGDRGRGPGTCTGGAVRRA